MLGSDYPLALGEDHPGQLIESIEDMDDTTKVTSCRTIIGIFWMYDSYSGIFGVNDVLNQQTLVHHITH